jgi:hypothetical protein
MSRISRLRSDDVPVVFAARYSPRLAGQAKWLHEGDSSRRLVVHLSGRGQPVGPRAANQQLRQHVRMTPDRVRLAGPGDRRGGRGADICVDQLFCRDLPARAWSETDFATSRAHSMKRFAVGVSIRFFNVMISAAWEIPGNLTGKMSLLPRVWPELFRPGKHFDRPTAKEFTFMAVDSRLGRAFSRL